MKRRLDIGRSAARLWTNAHAAIYRLTDGRVGSSMRGARVLLLTTAGAGPADHAPRR